MRSNLACALMAVGIGLAACGCVERKMLIRSEPSGAPVWVDEQYAGDTPLDHPFAHYGYRNVRVGPIRDEKDKLQFREKEQVVELAAPWFQTFPIDFFAEVLWPGRVTDEHEVPPFALEPVAGAPKEPVDERVEQIREEALEFRDRAVHELPEAGAGD